MKKKVLIFSILIILSIGFVVAKQVKAGCEQNVYGWAWSENIGWISFNSTNCDPNINCAGPDRVDRRLYTNTDYFWCPVSYADYGVHIDPSTGLFSGGAWSSNIGWISFNRSETGDPPNSDVCPDGSCTAKLDLDLDTYEVSGWAGWQSGASVPERYEGFDESDEPSYANVTFGVPAYGNLWRGQTFTTGSEEFKISYVSLKLSRNGNPGKMIVSIREFDFDPKIWDKVSMNLLGPDKCMGTIDTDDFDEEEDCPEPDPDDPDADIPECQDKSSWEDIPLNDAVIDGCVLSPNSKYILIERAPDGNEDNSIVLRTTSMDRYLGGERWYYKAETQYSDFWFPVSGDRFFQIYGISLIDGWIKLRGNIQTGGIYGVNLDTTKTPHEFYNWAWGGGETREQAMVGWVSFNCRDTGACSDNMNYKVLTDLLFNRRPEADNLERDQDAGCGDSALVNFRWDYEDEDNDPAGQDPQSDCEFQIDDDEDWSDEPMSTLGCFDGTSQRYGNLSFGTTYYWRVRVMDTKGPAWSDWASGDSITPTEWPRVDFTWCPQEPSIGESVQFCSVFEPGVCDIEAGCSDMARWADNLVYCAEGCKSNGWEWDFAGTKSNKKNPAFTYSVSGTQSVKLTVTDLNNKSCSEPKSLTGKIPLPIWREIPPF